MDAAETAARAGRTATERPNRATLRRMNEFKSHHTEWHQFDLVDAMEEGVCCLSPDQKIYFTNVPVEKMLGVTSADLLGRSFLDLFPDSKKGEVEEGFSLAYEEGRSRLQTAVVWPGTDREIPVLLRMIRYDHPNEEKRGMYAVMLDLTELTKALRDQEYLKERNRELEDLVVTDPLTGIYNRRYFELRYAEEVARAHRYGHDIAVAMLDLDRFKEVNDSYGHKVGDLVLRHTANTLRETVRSSDIVARYGGEEFVLVLPEIRMSGLLPLAIRLRQKIQAKTLNTDKGPLNVTASIGLACWTSADKPLHRDDLLQRADEALYKAKEAGRNRVVLYGHPVA